MDNSRPNQAQNEFVRCGYAEGEAEETPDAEKEGAMNNDAAVIILLGLAFVMVQLFVIGSRVKRIHDLLEPDGKEED